MRFIELLLTIFNYYKSILVGDFSWFKKVLWLFFKVFFILNYIKIIFFYFLKLFLISVHQNDLKILKKIIFFLKLNLRKSFWNKKINKVLVCLLLFFYFLFSFKVCVKLYFFFLIYYVFFNLVFLKIFVVNFSYFLNELIVF